MRQCGNDEMELMKWDNVKGMKRNYGRDEMDSVGGMKWD